MAEENVTGQTTEEQDPTEVSTDTQQTIEVPDPQQDPQAAPAPETDPQVSNPEWFKPDTFQLKYRGQTVAPKDYQHAVNLMQQGWSYSEAMRSLKTEKDEFESQKGKFTQYEQLEQAFQRNPAFAQKIWSMYQEAQGNQGGQQQQQQMPTPQDPQYQQLFQMVSGMQDRMRAQDSKDSDAQVKQEIETIKASMPTVQWDQQTETGHTLIYDVLNHARQGQFPTLTAAARDYLWDTQQANARMSGAQQAANAKQRATRQGVVQTGKPTPTQGGTKTVNVKDVSYDKLAEMALKSLGK